MIVNHYNEMRFVVLLQYNQSSEYNERRVMSKNYIEINRNVSKRQHRFNGILHKPSLFYVRLKE